MIPGKLAFRMSFLPWELEDEICKLACTSLRGILIMRSVCHRWKKIANLVHKEKVSIFCNEILKVHYHDDPVDHLLSRLLLYSSYRPRKVDRVWHKLYYEFITQHLVYDTDGLASGFKVKYCFGEDIVLTKGDYLIDMSSINIFIQKGNTPQYLGDAMMELGMNRESFERLRKRALMIRRECYQLNLGT